MAVPSLPPLGPAPNGADVQAGVSSPAPVRMSVPFPPRPEQTTRTPAVTSAGQQFKVTLVSTVYAVNTGVPVGPVPGGYGICLDDPAGFAASRVLGGEDCVAYASMVLETYLHQFEPGKRYAIADIDDEGRLTFTRDDDSDYRATSTSRIMLRT